MEEPYASSPVPSQHPAFELAADTVLDLTPDRKKTSSRNHRSKGVADSNCNKKLELKQPQVRPSYASTTLSQPHLNSTAQLYSKIHTLKHHHPQHTTPPPPPYSEENSHKISPCLSTASELQHIVHNRPLKEVNVPSDALRYSNLRSVDVSEESFTKMTVRPRKSRHTTTAAASKAETTSEDQPDIMEIFSPEMECEEADWTVGRCTASLEPVSVPMDAPFALYKHMHK